MLSAVAELLQEVAQNAHTNKMNPANLATIVFPSILTPHVNAMDLQQRFRTMSLCQEMVTLFILSWDDLFQLLPHEMPHDRERITLAFYQQSKGFLGNV